MIKDRNVAVIDIPVKLSAQILISRGTFCKIRTESLCQSIKTYGVLQPINKKIGEDSYELVAGERRLRLPNLHS